MVLRLMIPNTQVGTIIGKGGANIKGIRELSGCKMQIADMVIGSTERLVSITGSVTGVTKAVELMLGVIEEPGSKTSDGGSSALNPEMASEGTGQSHTLKLVLNNNQVGGIIGKGGSMIKQMREESGAFIKVEATPTAEDERIGSVQG
eukprot:3939585-Pleurochrysis_carterae.AAC.1